MPFFFFTDPTMVAAQDADEAYGKVSTRATSGEKTFLVTSVHKSINGGDAANTNYLSNPPAIAVTSGRICVIAGSMQATLHSPSPIYDNELVTVVLKPDEQPGGNIPNVKYFIYKGVLLKSLLQPQLAPDSPSDPPPVFLYKRYLLNTANAGVIPFIARVQADFNVLTGATGLPPVANAGIELDDRYIGVINVNPSLAEDAPKRIIPNAYTSPPATLSFFSEQTLDDIFNSNWNVLSDIPGNTGTIAELPFVNGGETIGFFRDRNHDVNSSDDGVETGTFGFEIVIDGPQNLGYEIFPPPISAPPPSLSNPSKRFKISSDPVMKMVIGSKDGEPDIDVYNPIFRKVAVAEDSSHPFYTRSKKLEILNYLDPCAFYGTFSNPGALNLFYVVAGAIQGISAPGDIQSTKNNNLYETILTIFQNRNKIYIDIRDKFNNPYNIFRDKSYFPDSSQENNLKIFFNNTSTPENIDYYGHDGAVGSFSTVPDWPILIIDIESNHGGRGFPSILLPPAPAPTSVNINIGFAAIPSLFGSASVNVLNYSNNLDYNATLLTDQGINQINLLQDFRGFIKLPSQISSYTDDLRLLNPTYTAASVTNITPISNYFRLWHIFHNKNFKDCEVLSTYFDDANLNTVGDNMRTNPTENAYMADYPIPLENQPSNYLDFLFPIEFGIHWNLWGNNFIRNTIYSDGVYIDNTRFSGRDFIGSIGIARDATPIIPGVVPQTSFCIIEKDPPALIENEIDRSFQRMQMVTRGGAGGAVVNTSSYIEWLGSQGTDNIIVNSTNVLGRQLYYLTYRPLVFPIYEQVRDFVHITIDTADYDAAIQNFLTDNSTEISNKQILLKAFWSFKPISVGYDGNSGKNVIQYRVFIKYFLRFTTGVQHVELKEYDTGFNAFQLADDVNITFLNSPNISPGSGFSIDNSFIGSVAVKKINTTIYLAKGIGVTYLEFLRYKDYFEKNIKSVWTTPNIPGVVDPLDYNTGFLAPLDDGSQGGIDKVSAQDIILREATPDQFRGLQDGELLFIVDRSKYLNVFNWNAANGPVPQPGNDRSAVLPSTQPVRNGLGNIVDYLQYARVGRMVIDSPFPAGTEGIADDPDAIVPCPILPPFLGDNAPAHEFGHALGLADRYTFAVQIDANNEIIDNTDVGASFYLPSTYDAAYADDCRWVNNLMGSAGKVPNPSSPLYPAQYGTDLPATFPALINGYESDNNNPLTAGRGNRFFITNTQWNIIQNYATNNSLFEANPVTNPIFKFQNVVHFTRVPANKTIHFFGHDPSTGLTYSDFQYAGAAEDMNSRGNVPMNLFGFAGPLTLSNGMPSSNIFPSLTGEAADSPEIAIDLKIGNNIPIILPNILNAPGPNDFPNENDDPAFVDPDPMVFNIFPFIFNAGNAGAYTGMNLTVAMALNLTVYNNIDFIVDPAQSGRVVWNRISLPGIDPNENLPFLSNATGSILRHNIHYRTYYINRLKIIQIIVFGGG